MDPTDRLTRTGHNSGSRSPFDTLTSALDRTFRDLSNGHSFRACTLPNNGNLESEILQKQSEKVAGSRGGSPRAGGLGSFAPPVQQGVWGAAGPQMIRRREIALIKILTGKTF